MIFLLLPNPPNLSKDKDLTLICSEFIYGPLFSQLKCTWLTMILRSLNNLVVLIQLSRLIFYSFLSLPSTLLVPIKQKKSPFPSVPCTSLSFCCSSSCPLSLEWPFLSLCIKPIQSSKSDSKGSFFRAFSLNYSFLPACQMEFICPSLMSPLLAEIQFYIFPHLEVSNLLKG